jgi:hypothetical protein
VLQVALLPSSLQTPGGFAKPYSLALVRQALFPSLVSSHIRKIVMHLLLWVSVHDAEFLLDLVFKSVSLV